MDFTGLVRGLFASDTSLYECRHCGTPVDDSTDVCPACDSSEIARYDF